MVRSVASRPGCPNGAAVQLLPGYARLSGSTSLAGASASPRGDRSRSFKVDGSTAATGCAVWYGLSLLVTMSPCSWLTAEPTRRQPVNRGYFHLEAAPTPQNPGPEVEAQELRRPGLGGNRPLHAPKVGVRG